MSEAMETVTINDVNYSVEDLSEEQRYMIAQVNDLRGKMSQLRFNLDQLMIAEQHFVKMVTESVEEKDDVKQGAQE